jgi:hypothetical protein
MNTWIACKDLLPKEGKVVETKIDDAHGVRNQQTLMLKSRLWWFPDGSMYVYYAPTHWRSNDH